MYSHLSSSRDVKLRKLSEQTIDCVFLTVFSIFLDLYQKLSLLTNYILIYLVESHRISARSLLTSWIIYRAFWIVKMVLFQLKIESKTLDILRLDHKSNVKCSELTWCNLSKKHYLTIWENITFLDYILNCFKKEFFTSLYFSRQSLDGILKASRGKWGSQYSFK